MIYQYSKTKYARALNTYLFFKPADYDLLRLCKVQSPDFYHALVHTLSEIYYLYDDIDPSKVNSDELLYLIISRWEKLYLYLYNTFTNCHILVYSPFGSQHADILAQALRAKVERAVGITIYTKPFLNEQELGEYSFDILVSSVSLELNIEQPVIVFLSNLNRKHLMPLYNAIDHVIQKKVHVK